MEGAAPNVNVGLEPVMVTVNPVMNWSGSFGPAEELVTNGPTFCSPASSLIAGGSPAIVNVGRSSTGVTVMVNVCANEVLL